QWNSLFHREVGALEIYCEHPIPLGFRDLDDSTDFGNAYIVVEHIDTAIGGGAGFDHRDYIGGLTDVGTMCNPLPTLAPDDPRPPPLPLRRPGRPRGRVCIDAPAAPPSPPPREGNRRCLAITPPRTDGAGAHDERDFALESVDHSGSLLAGCVEFAQLGLENLPIIVLR